VHQQLDFELTFESHVLVRYIDLLVISTKHLDKTNYVTRYTKKVFILTENNKAERVQMIVLGSETGHVKVLNTNCKKNKDDFSICKLVRYCNVRNHWLKFQI